MMTSILFILWIPAASLFFFAAYQFIFLLFSAGYWIFASKEPLPSNKKTRFGIIIPAHNEEVLIGGLVKSIQWSEYPQDQVHIYVIADNCDDRTAEIVRGLGADCRERFNDEKRGKPYALDWLISSIDLDQHDAYIIIDADTTIDKNFLLEMDRVFQDGHEVIQGYFGVMNPDENWLTRLSILPGVLKFLLHFPGKKIFNLSCPLAGNGMCFSKAIFKKFGWNAYSIAENWEYYIRLTLEGYRVTSAEKAMIYSQVARSLKTGKDQRQRWQRGRLETFSTYWKILMKKAILERDFAQFDAMLEVMRPSHSLLLFGSILFSLISGVLNYYSPIFETIFVFSLVTVLLQIIYFLSGLIVQKAPLRTWLSLFMVPPYLVWKVLISITGLKNKNKKEWIKTERH